MNLRVLSLSMICASWLCAGSAQAALSVAAIPGGGPKAGSLRFSFDDLVPGSASPQSTTSVGGAASLQVTFAGSAGIVSGTAPGYTAPFLSGNNGDGFAPGGANQALGADATPYLTSGATGFVRGSQVSLVLPSAANYFGLLWGSIDFDNQITFLRNGASVGSINGSGVTASPNGDPGQAGTRYVNLSSTLAFDTVVFTGTASAFEFDNVALDPLTPIPVPGAAGMLAIGLAGLAWAARRRRFTSTPR
jgi:hypothetical protein